MTHPRQPVLRGDRVLLRPWHPQDAEVLTAEVQDPEVVRWLDITTPYTVADAAGFIDTAGREWRRGVAAHFVVEHGGDFAGYVAALGLEGALTEVEIVYWVAAHRRGAGVATEAVETILGWLVAEGTSRIELGMTAGNLPSAAVAGKAGFELRETRPAAAVFDGEPADEWIYELPVSRWEGPAVPG